MTQYILNTDIKKGKINKHIYGHFSEHLGRCIYEGYWVGEDSPIPNTRGIRNDVVAALKKAKVPNLRWPGGCFADEYHWMDGIGPRQDRPKIINVHWGGVVENNHFGTHEFLDLCEQVGAEPYICGNVGSGTVREMRDWVEYMTFDGTSPMADLRRKNGREKPWKLPFFGVGNENWGCGGNMRPEYYADLYRRYASYVREFSGNRIQRFACGPSDASYHWTEVLMREAAWMMQGLTLHYYTVPYSWQKRGLATVFTETDWCETMRKTWFMEELITKHSTIMDRYDPEKKVGLVVDEWGTWYDAEPGTNPGFLYQQNSLRDALVAGINLNIFNAHCGRVRMANIAQTVNVLQALVLTEGAKMLLTPTYHVFDMYKVHQDADLLSLDLAGEAPSLPGGGNALSASASMDAQGLIHISLCNAHPKDNAVVNFDIRGAACRQVTGTILTHTEITAHNTFDKTDRLAPVGFTGARITGGKLEADIPARSVVVLELSK